jgi:hypothetical protein
MRYSPLNPSSQSRGRDARTPKPRQRSQATPAQKLPPTQPYKVFTITEQVKDQYADKSIRACNPADATMNKNNKITAIGINA